MTRYADRKPQIREVLVDRAKRRQTITYQDLGAAVGIPQTGPWKEVLDEISHEERGAGRADITYLAVSKTTGLPSQIEFQSSKPPRAEQRRIAKETMDKIFDEYAE